MLPTGHGHGIYLRGGATLASALLAAEQIDEVRLKVDPFSMGRGTPLFSSPTRAHALSLLDSKAYSNGVLLPGYRVEQGRAAL